MHQAKVLVVEDDFYLMQALGIVFQEHGFEVQFCVDGKTGLSLAHSWQPDVILLDVRLPELDGLSVLAELKQKPETATIPILIMTGYPDEAGRKIAISLGAIGYLAKPLSPEQLVSIIEERVKGSAALRRLTRTGTTPPTVQQSVPPPRPRELKRNVPLKHAKEVEVGNPSEETSHRPDQTLRHQLPLRGGGAPPS